MSRPVPIADETSAFHWAAASEGRLLVQRCADCGRWQYPPDVACAGCQSERIEPTEVSGRGELYSFTIVRQAFDPDYARELPFVVALVELAEQPGLRMLTNIVGAAPESLRIGMPVALTFETREGVARPQFRPC
jgi:uncharacterized OB-fold protein